MKKLVLNSFALIIVTLILSCQKENNVNEAISLNDYFDISIPTSNYGDETVDGPDGPTRFFYDYLEQGFGCWEGGSDCFDDVVIKPKKEDLISNSSNKLDAEIQRFINDVSNKKQSKNILKDNINLLEPIIGTKAITAINEGKLTIDFRGNNFAKGIYIVIRHDNKVFAVFPLKDKDNRKKLEVITK